MAAVNPPTNPEYPWYALKADEKENGDFMIFKIRIDSDEGREYAKLTTHSDRLAYMRKHHHDSYETIQVSQSVWTDDATGKRYAIWIRSPEGEELERLLSKPRESRWPPEGSKELREIQDYYKEHAHEVVDVETGAVLVSLPSENTQTGELLSS
jgi:hypothetical protein